MAERPILFSAPMVRAILAGTKTQTRRIVKPQPVQDDHGFWSSDGKSHCGSVELWAEHVAAHCPYGQPGDRLWVRESGWERPERTPKMMREGADTWPRFAYAADDWSDDDRADFRRWGFKVRPSIHMPRWASRILLEITAIRVERLNDISEADAREEGITDGGCTECGNPEPCWCHNPSPDPCDAYCHLWEQINGPDSWSANPWVWVVEFRKVKP